MKVTMEVTMEVTIKVTMKKGTKDVSIEVTMDVTMEVTMEVTMKRVVPVSSQSLFISIASKIFSMPPEDPFNTSRTIVTPAAKIFQDQLHDIITRLSVTMAHVKNWNEAADNSNSTANVHVESTTRLIELIQSIVKSIQKVESTLQNNVDLRQVLQNIYVPYDLLELLDYTNINPDIYLRGLVNEATGQLVGLQRRKNALHLLSTTIENRLNEQDQAAQPFEDETVNTESASDANDDMTKEVSEAVPKRERESLEESAVNEMDEPPNKKPKL
jgi:Transcription factor subunit Med10 of Mediator complex